MGENDMIERLMMFALTRQEAAIYLCLLKNGELTGYEAAKITGISRSNVYSTLAGLVEHGAAYLIEGVSSKYVPVPMKEFCANRLRQLKEVAGILTEHAPRVKESIEGYITIEGKRHVMDKVHHMLAGAGQRIYLSAPASFIELWLEELTELVGRSIKVVLITEKQPRDLPPEGVIIYLSEEKKDSQIRLIIDSSYVLTGEVTGNESDNCLYCAQKNFVNVFKEAMSNEIKLIELKRN